MSGSSADKELRRKKPFQFALEKSADNWTKLTGDSKPHANPAREFESAELENESNRHSSMMSESGKFVEVRSIGAEEIRPLTQQYRGITLFYENW